VPALLLLLLPAMVVVRGCGPRVQALSSSSSSSSITIAYLCLERHLLLLLLAALEV
jgi:hypothetical protein